MNAIPDPVTGLLPAGIAGQYGMSPAFRGTQLFRWIYRGAQSFSQMSDLPALERERLSALYPTLYDTSVADTLSSPDGSTKLKIRLSDGSAIESVLLSDSQGRLTACLSTQVGCPMACAFCKTGTLGLLRDLKTHEIMEQFLHLQALRGRLSNVVFMGMGEPLLNLAAVRSAIAILTHPDGPGLSNRKITISTCGIVPGILDLAHNGPHVRLAVSITSADNTVRDSLMPVNKQWNLASLKDTLVTYQAASGDRITLEAAIMGGRNAGAQAARDMASWIGSLKTQVNVIPWNPVDGLPFKEPSRQEVDSFENELERLGITTVRRARRGRQVGGACGQLGDTLEAYTLPDED
ncbi:MAG TPA: 23S rRNA (adenine(2503)-C(2))-methyltransferase RlmN [Spirochaetales bacterium]|nr:23S rRNA (adenine(2503)-C(2))-methyltransferase RlmN [Spirochaetales bacterium]